MLAKTTHIVPVNGEWTVKREGSSRAVGVYSTRKKAIEAAHEIVRRSAAGQVVIHGLSGQIRVVERHGLPPVQSPPRKSGLGRKRIAKAVWTVIRERLLGD